MKVTGKLTVTEVATTAFDVPTKQQLDTGVANAKDFAQATGSLTAAQIPTLTVSKISDFSTALETRISALLGGATSAYDTLKEIQDFLQADDTADAALVAALDAAKARITALENATPPQTAPQEFTSPAVAANATWTVTHSKARRVIVQVYEVATNEQVLASVTSNASGGNTVQIGFGSAGAAAGQYVALVL